MIAPEPFIAKMPADVSFEEAACLGTPGITAWNGLVDKATVKAGDRVFINGCTGAVGESAVQIARMFGASVSGTVSAQQRHRAEQLAVHPVLDYRTTDLSRLRDRFDAVYDTAGTMSVASGLGLIRKGGVFLDITPTPGKFIRAMFNKGLKPIVCTARADILDALAKAAGEGRLRLPIAVTVPLRDAIPQVITLEEGRKLNGKVVVAMP